MNPMNPHAKAIREALEQYVHGVSANGTNASSAWDTMPVLVEPTDLGENVQATVHSSTFNGMTIGERQSEVWKFLRLRLAPEHLVHLALVRTLAQDEWDVQPGIPPLTLLSA